MSKAFAAVIHWLGWKALSLLLIIALLVAGAWFHGELKRADQLVAERVALLSQKANAQRHVQVTGSRADPAQSDGAALQALIAKRKQAREEFRAAHRLASRVPLTDAWHRIKAMDAEIAVEEQMLAKVTEIDARIATLDEAIHKGFLPRLLAVVREQMPAALAILAALIVLPVVTKLLLYFVIAPIASGRPPIRIMEGRASGDAAHQAGKISAVSWPVLLAPDEELLVQPGYLQSSPLEAQKQTRWLLDWSVPFSSLLSGMFMLTRVTTAGNEPVVISATGDSLSEVGILELADGEVFVCQPRSLVGVVQRRSQPMRITRHWRIGHLQSWLTLQLRFLAFHGPARLMLKGCRGIRVESAGKGRLINQAATLGFSANVAYASTRCETFVAYWTGKEDLFNDLFTGDGIYVYEETTDPKRKGGITGRGLQGFTDALLKLVGV
ncbi:MAG TPA: hypothetical protein VK996_00615 [Ramlibacter sp.]|nr:hypothetical protein [Ramlibacter sp.]